MLNVYLYKAVNTQLNNEDYFTNKTVKTLSLYKDTLKAVAKLVDNAEVHDTTISAFGLTTYVSNLSTGCKTVLNVLLNQDTVFSIKECGTNAKDLLFDMSTGSIYVDATLRDVTTQEDDTVNVFISESEVKVMTFKELVDYVN